MFVRFVEVKRNYRKQGAKGKDKDKEFMINKILLSVAEALNVFLGSYYERPEKMAEIGMIGGTEEGSVPNKMIVSLLNVEKEGAAGRRGESKGSGGSALVQGAPAWHLNVWFMVAAVFSERRYGEALKMLSASIGFLQQNVLLTEEGRTYVIELMTLDMQGLTNLWSIQGGRYYPSVVCRIRMLTFDSEEVKRTVGRVKGMQS